MFAHRHIENTPLMRDTFALLKDRVKTAHRRVEFYCEKKCYDKKSFRWGFSVSELKSPSFFLCHPERREGKWQ